MTFIIVTRNPRTKKLVVVNSGLDPEDFEEFQTESEATAVAVTVPTCKAWGFEVVEVGNP